MNDSLLLRKGLQSREGHALLIGRAVTAGILTMSTTVAWAMDLSAQPQLRLGVRGTDNILFTTANQESAVGFDNGGGAVLKAESSTWRSIVNPSFNLRRFIVGENLDADEYAVKTQHTWTATSRLKPELKVDYIHDSTLTTELTDSGRQNDVANRETINIQPSLAYLWDEKTSLTASFTHQDVKFDSGQENGLIGFKFDQATFGVSRLFAADLQTFANLFVSRFDVPEVGSTTMTYGAQTGLTYQYSADFAVDLAGGYVTSNIEFVERFLALVVDPTPRIVQLTRPAEANSNGPIASASFRKSFENLRARFDYIRRVTPSARGAQTLEDDMALSLDRDLSKQTIVGFRGAYNIRTAELEQVGGTIGELNRNQALLSSYLSYQYSREILLRAEYRFVRQQVTNADTAINSNAIFLSLNYNGDTYFLPGF